MCRMTAKQSRWDAAAPMLLLRCCSWLGSVPVYWLSCVFAHTLAACSWSMLTAPDVCSAEWSVAQLLLAASLL